MQSRIVLLAPLPEERKPGIGRRLGDALKLRLALYFIALSTSARTAHLNEGERFLTANRLPFTANRT
jgi:hypothetical protein